MLAEDSKGRSDLQEFIVEYIVFSVADTDQKVAAQPGKGGKKDSDAAKDARADGRQSMIERHGSATFFLLCVCVCKL